MNTTTHETRERTIDLKPEPYMAIARDHLQALSAKQGTGSRTKGQEVTRIKKAKSITKQSAEFSLV